jgi:hypothetical protein
VHALSLSRPRIRRTLGILIPKSAM